jgi:AcrR family transcriptional regulator
MTTECRIADQIDWEPIAGMSDTEAPARPTLEARRQQILDAASDCVRRSGFHGASMSEIAKAARLSVGQIYRYFENKEAIIAAIVDQDLAEMREKFAEFEREPGDIVQRVLDKCGEALDRHWNTDRAALMLEVLAEAARNPKVAAIIQRSDAEERAIAIRLFERIRRPEWCEGEMGIRVELMGMLFEGMAVRSINNPQIDRERTAMVLKSVMAAILGLPQPKAACEGEDG